MTDRASSVRQLTICIVLLVVMAPITGVVAAGAAPVGAHASAVDSDDTDRTNEPGFTVDILVGTVSLERNSSYNTTAVIENTGDEADIQDVEVRFNGTTIDVYRGVSLSPGERTGVNVSFDTTGFAPGEYNVTASSADHSDTLNVTVREPPKEAFFDVEIVGTNAPFAPGPPLSVDVRVTNTGNQTDTQDVQFYFEGEAKSDIFFDPTLEPGESATGGFSWATNTLRPGEYQIGVRSEDDEDVQQVVIEEPVNGTDFHLRGSSLESVEAGETLNVSTVVQNLGKSAGTQNLSLIIDSEIVASEQVTLPSVDDLSNHDGVYMPYQTTESDIGTLNVTVRSENDTLVRSVEVTDPQGDREPEPVYWQVDFGAGTNPPAPPAYWPNDLMAALGNSTHGVLQNPSVLRQRNESQLGAVNIVDNEFKFDDEGDPTEVTVRFEVDEGADPRDLHLAVYTLPGPFELDEIDQQELFALANGTYDGGETGELTVSIPQPDDVSGKNTTNSRSISGPPSDLASQSISGPLRSAVAEPVGGQAPHHFRWLAAQS